MGGIHEGLEDSGPARLRPGPGEGTKHHAGYLSGRVLAWLAPRQPLDDELILTAIGYASALATPEGQRLLPEPTGPREDEPSAPSALKAHMFAVALVEKKRGERLDAGLERLFFAWLLEATGTLGTPELVEKMEEMRRRRLKLTGL